MSNWELVNVYWQWEDVLLKKGNVSLEMDKCIMELRKYPIRKCLIRFFIRNREMSDGNEKMFN